MRKQSVHDIRRQHRNTDFKDTLLEQEFIAGVLRSRTVLEEVNRTFDSLWLTSDRNKRVYDMVIDLYLDTGQLMDSTSFKNSLSVHKDKRRLYLSLWNKIRKQRRKTSAPSTLTAAKKLEQLFTARNIQIGLQNASDQLGQAIEGDFKFIEKAREVLQVTNEQLHDHTSKRVVVIDPVDALVDFKKQFRKIQKDPSAVIGVPTGIDKLDRYMVGLRKSELGMVCGPSGSGKSITILEFGVNACMISGQHVCVVTIEMPHDQYMQRVYCHMAGIEYERFRKYQLTSKDWKRIEQAMDKLAKSPGSITIIDMPEGCTVPACRAEVQKVGKKKDIGMVIVDYMNIMCGPSGVIDFGWQNQLEIAVQMKLEFARALRVPIWSACQTNGKDDFGFSTHIKDQLDVAGVLQPQERQDVTDTDGNTEKPTPNSGNGDITWKWIKTRDFEGYPVVLETNQGFMRMTPLPTRFREEEHQVRKLKSKRSRVKV